MNIRIITKSGIEGWQGLLQDQYSCFDEFLSASDTYGLADRLGYEDTLECWNDNPIVQGSTNPTDYCKVKRPKVKLVGSDGNAFAVLGKCIQAARKAKWTQDQITGFRDEATSGDYDHLLGVCMKYFDVK